MEMDYPTYQFSSTSSQSSVYTGGGFGGMSTRPTLGATGISGTPVPTAVGAHSHFDRNGDHICDYPGCGATLGTNAGTPGGQVNPADRLPIGDGIVVLLVMAVVYILKKRLWISR